MPQDRKIIDFRNRPLVLPFKGLYDLKANFLMKAGMKAVNRGANTATPAMAQDGIGAATHCIRCPSPAGSLIFFDLEVPSRKSTTARTRKVGECSTST